MSFYRESKVAADGHSATILISGIPRKINSATGNAVNHNNEDEAYDGNVPGLSNIAIGTRERVRITIRGNVGDLIGALNDGAMIHVEGSAGKYAADGMTDGEVIIDGDADDGAGTAMYGGTLVIKGNARNDVGQLLKGGTIIVGGNVGHHVGSFMINGTIIIGGHAGRQLGSSMIGGAIYIKGKHGTIGLDLRQTELTEEDKELLEKLLGKYQLNRNSSTYKKITTRTRLL